jgi:fido (protein-threonine AMPylation protein)
MTDPDFSGQPDGATPIDDASGLKQSHIYTLAQLNEAEALNILAAVDWIERGRVGSVFQLSFHHRLVWVHPFRNGNGNGRWARLACDAVAIRVLKQPPIVWASGDLATASQERSTYIEALRAADGLDHRPLVQYLSEHNPDRD